MRSELHSPQESIVHLKILNTSKRFRAALECVSKTENDLIEGFPSGRCGEACDLLSECLREMGFTEISYLLGVRAKKPGHGVQSHAWLEVHGFIVDITLDQFESSNPGTFVAKDSVFHSSFEIIDQCIPGFKQHQKTSSAEYASTYDTAMKIFRNL